MRAINWFCARYKPTICQQNLPCRLIMGESNTHYWFSMLRSIIYIRNSWPRNTQPSHAIMTRSHFSQHIPVLNISLINVMLTDMCSWKALLHIPRFHLWQNHFNFVYFRTLFNEVKPSRLSPHLWWWVPRVEWLYIDWELLRGGL